MTFDRHNALCVLSGPTAVVLNVIRCFHTIHTCLAAFTPCELQPVFMHS